MEENCLKRHRPSTGDRSMYYQETSAVNDLATNRSSAAMGNLADVLKSGPVSFPNILAPDSFRQIPIGTSETTESDEADKQ